MMASMVGCGKKADKPTSNATLRVSTFDEPVYLLHEPVLNYLQADEEALVTYYLVNGIRTDKGKPVTISYEVENPEREIESAYVELSLT